MEDTFKSNEPITYYYKFKFENELEKVFIIKLHPKTLKIVPVKRDSYPAWTNLTHCQCPNCPLNEAEHPHCPIATNVVDLIDFFQKSISYEKVLVEIISKERTYVKETALQSGVSSVLGIYMVTSGCPIMNRLRPMVRTHLPFNTVRETTYRLLSMYLLSQYFASRHGHKPDWEMKNLKKIFQDIQTVNKYFWQRFASAKVEDASLNALVHLDTTAQFVAFSVDEDLLSDMELLFDAYF